MTLNPTAEQQAILTAVATGQTTVIEAGAGTGKTATLRMIAESQPAKRILYVAYNKAIQVEAAKSFPSNVEARTAHSLAYRGFADRTRLQGNKLSPRDLANFLHIQSFESTILDEPYTFAPEQIASIVKVAIGRFCNSADEAPKGRNIPGQPGMSDTQRHAFVDHVLPYVKQAWTDISSKSGRLPWEHDYYLKLWSLSQPTLSFDMILFDEAQDANPAIAAVLENQSSQIVYVGDSAQAIYGWRGAVDAMKNVDAPHRLFLSQSFRFGQVVADEANRLLTIIGTPLRLTGFEAIDSKLDTLESPNVILCRTNGGVIESAMAAQANGNRVAIVGGTADIESFVRAAQRLMEVPPVRVNHRDLSIYRSWSQVQKAVRDGEADDIATMVRLVDNYGVEAILAVCAQSTKPDQADVIVSTAHKAKGLEWDSVRIHHDFKAPKEGMSLSISEAMLIYVAITRSRLILDHSALAWLAEVEAEIGGLADES